MWGETPASELTATAATNVNTISNLINAYSLALSSLKRQR
jgi:hypothetical protein